MKYKKPATKEDIKSLRIEVHKERDKIVGFTVWADKHWVLDGSVMKDGDEERCRVYTGNRNQPIQFEYVEQKFDRNFLELRRK